MKKQTIFILFLCVFVLSAGSAFGETVKENPSFYSFAEVAQKLPALWTSKPADVMAVMEAYPDFTCRKHYDILSCQSVNNKYSAEIHLNFQFMSEDDDAELSRTVFTMLINTAEDVQKVIENLWLPGMKAANLMGGASRKDVITLYFSTADTLMTVSFPWNYTGSVWMITVDMGLIRG